MLSLSTNVVNIINSLKIGGAENLLVRFVEDLNSRLNVTANILTIYNGDSVTKLTPDRNVTTTTLNIRKKYAINIPVRLIREIRKRNYRIIHVHLFPASLFVALASYFINKQTHLIFTEHNVFNRRRLLPWFRVIDRLIYSRYKKIICVSNTVKTELLKWIPQLQSKIVVVNNGIPISPLPQKSSKRFDIIFVGRLTTAKGLDILLRSLSKLKPRKLINSVAIVGSGPLLPMLEEQARELELDKIISFLGARDDIDILLQQSKLFVLPSRWEGLPLSVLEAMAAELPIVASNVGGVPDVIYNGVNGILVPPEEPQLLAGAIEKVLTNKRLASMLGQNARIHIEQHHSITQYSNNILGIYNELT